MPDITHELDALHVLFNIALDELGKHWGKPGMAEDVVTLNRPTRHWDTQAASCVITVGADSAARSASTAAVTSGV